MHKRDHLLVAILCPTCPVHISLHTLWTMNDPLYSSLSPASDYSYLSSPSQSPEPEPGHSLTPHSLPQRTSPPTFSRTISAVDQQEQQQQYEQDLQQQRQEQQQQQEEREQEQWQQGPQPPQPPGRIPEKVSILATDPQSELISISDFSSNFVRLLQQQEQNDPLKAYLASKNITEQDLVSRCDIFDDFQEANQPFEDPTVLGLLQEWFTDRIEDRHEEILAASKDKPLRPTWSSVYGLTEEVNEAGDTADIHMRENQMNVMNTADNKVRRLLSAPMRGHRRVPYDTNRTALRHIQEKEKHRWTRRNAALEGPRKKGKQQVLEPEDELDKRMEEPTVARHARSELNPQHIQGSSAGSSSSSSRTGPDQVQDQGGSSSGTTTGTETPSIARSAPSTEVASVDTLMDTDPNQDERTNNSEKTSTGSVPDKNFQSLALFVAEMEAQRSQGTQQSERSIESIRPTNIELKFQDISLKIEDSPLRSLQVDSHFLLPPHQREPLNYLQPEGSPFSRPYVPIIDPGETVIVVEFFSSLKPTLKVQETMFLGSQPLSTLRDTFYCLTDFTSKSEFDERGNENSKIRNAEKKKTSNSFLFIEGTFYIDSPLLRARVDEKARLVAWEKTRKAELQEQCRTRREDAVAIQQAWLQQLEREGQEPMEQDYDLNYDDSDLRAELAKPSSENVPLEQIALEDEAVYAAVSFDYSETILDWVQESPERKQSPEFQNLQKKVMAQTLIRDLSIRLNHPYLLVHQGNCEHIIKFKDLRLFSHQHDELNQLCYPKTVFRRKTIKHKCKMCRFNPAHFITVDDRLAGETPCYFCEQCYYDFHYDEEGNLLYDDFRVFPYSVTDMKEQ